VAVVVGGAIKAWHLPVFPALAPINFAKGEYQLMADREFRIGESPRRYPLKVSFICETLVIQ
jgi:hypothetical protein